VSSSTATRISTNGPSRFEASSPTVLGRLDRAPTCSAEDGPSGGSFALTRLCSAAPKGCDAA
jgi:hypothetical protein